MTATIESHWQNLWASGETRLFWYVLPPPEVHPAVIEIQGAIADPTVFAAMPLEWLHVTLVNTSVSFDEVDSLLQRTQGAVTRLSPFVVTPHSAVWRESVVCESPSIDNPTVWTQLRDAVDGDRPALGQTAVTFVPHMSVAYAHGNGDAVAVRAKLASVSAPPPWTVDAVSLVALRQRPGPAHGWYDWTLIGTAPLGRGSEY